MKNSTLKFKDHLNVYRTEVSHQKFIILLGVSGAGKSTIIREVQKLDDRFVYIRQFTTRPLRINETDKISISLQQMAFLEQQGKILMINMYETVYGAQLDLIETSLCNNHIPIIDWPLDKLEIMENKFGDKLFTVYITPPNLNVLKKRLESDDRNANGLRFIHAHKELELVSQGIFDDKIDLFITNCDGQAQSCARKIIKHVNSVKIQT